MATIDVQDRNAPLEAWIMGHGAAAALTGCFLFWLTIGITLYFAL
ncbi:MAG: hypothetical protein P4L57_01750 [Rhizomicrobium sp.]|nr:hypothetical protein [Rhizomicrobium sp.]